jgi:hypothetical protein
VAFAIALTPASASPQAVAAGPRMGTGASSIEVPNQPASDIFTVALPIRRFGNYLFL